MLARLAQFASRLTGVWGAPARPAVRNSFDSATTGRRGKAWMAPTVGPNAATLPNLSTLRARSRHAYRNDPYGGGAIDIRVEQLVGTGIAPRSVAADAAFRERVQRAWDRWIEQCDADGRLDFYGLQAQATRCWQEAGEVFIRLRSRLPSDGFAVPLQLQVLEPELCPETYDATRGMNTIRAGIERSPIGARVAYWFYRAHPADGTMTLNAGQLVALPAERVIHLYHPLRAGQLRGLPHLHRALLTMRDLDVGDDATLLRWQLGNMFMGWIQRSPAGLDPALDPLTGQAIQRDAKDQPMVAMEPGTMNDLLPGEELHFNEPPEAGQTYEAFMRQQLRKIAAAARVPYHALTGDMAQVNDRTIRVILQDFRRSLEQLQWQVLVHQLCQPVWTAWFDAAVVAGALPVPVGYFDDPEPWQRVEWHPDRWPYIHPVQDVQAEEMLVRDGFASRSQVVKARGYDVEEIDRQQAADHAREDAAGLVYDSDPRKTTQAGGSQDDVGNAEAASAPAASARVPASRVELAPPTVNVTLPPSPPAPPVNVAPVVNVTIPRPMRKRVHRDARGLITRIEEEIARDGE
jgi:lambda family phage portal protein